MRRICASTYMLIGLFIATLISYGLLTSTTTSANDATDTVSINVPASCSLTGNVDSAHNTTMANGVYKENIGTTTFSVFCNDNDGFGIYAIGYSGDTHGNNEMLSQNSSITRNIATGTATSGNTSSWAMKLTPVTGAITIAIDNGYNNYNVVPNVYTRVASFTSITNNLVTSKFQSTYSVYAAGDQPAGTYIGKVKYTITHPASVDPSAGQANLDTGVNINKKLKSLASGANVTSPWTSDTIITAFVRSDTLPANFAPSDTNTISVASSLEPVYVWFDSTDGTMYYYSRAGYIYMNNNSLQLLAHMHSLENISGLKYFITDNVTTMVGIFMLDYKLSDFTPIKDWKVDNINSLGNMFERTRISDLTPLANWNVGNATAMIETFSYTQVSDLSPISGWDVRNMRDLDSAFWGAKVSDLAPLANWDTSKVTSIYRLFNNTQISDLTPIQNWNVSNVTDMGLAFANTQISSLAPLANWGVSKATSVFGMFNDIPTLTDTSAIAGWNVNNVIGTITQKCGKVAPTGGDTFTNCFVDMFGGTTPRTNLPIFTSRPGTWNSFGTYIPNP